MITFQLLINFYHICGTYNKINRNFKYYIVDNKEGIQSKN